MKVYKIRDKESGLFYLAGLATMNEKGKIWSTLGAVRSAISHAYPRREITYWMSNTSIEYFTNLNSKNSVFCASIDVVEYELIEIGTRILPA